MPEQTFFNAKAFNPASFSMPAKPSLTYSVVVDSNQTELSAYVQTVHIRPSGTSPGATLSDQDQPSARGPLEMRFEDSGGQGYYRAQNDYREQSNYGQQNDYRAQDNYRSEGSATGQQTYVPPVVHGNSQHQRSTQFNLNDQSVGSSYQRPQQNQSFAPPADRSSLPYAPRTNPVERKQIESGASVLDVSRRKTQEEGSRRPLRKESQTSISKTKLVDLREKSSTTETPQRDQNTIAKKPDPFLKREPFSNRLSVKPEGKQEFENAGSNGKIIYLKSKPVAKRTAKLEVPKFVRKAPPATVAEILASPEPEPRCFKRMIPDFLQEPAVHFQAPALTVQEVPQSGFVSTARTTKIEFGKDPLEVGFEVAAKPATGTFSAVSESPFEALQAPAALAAPETEQAPVAVAVTETEQAPAAVAVTETVAVPETEEAPEAPFNSSPFESVSSFTPSQPKSFSVPVNDTPEVSSPVATISSASNTESSFSGASFSQARKNTTLEVRSERPDFSSQVSSSPSNSHINSFSAASHGPAETQSTKIILPAFKQSFAPVTSNPKLTAMTAQNANLTVGQHDHQFEVPWLSPWWMMIVLIPVALYFGTTRLFQDDDDFSYEETYGAEKNYKFGSDSGVLGSSKSDAVYGRQDKTPAVHGPCGKALELHSEASQSTLEFAQSIPFVLPSSKEFAPPFQGPELQPDQSPNFSETNRPSKKRRKKAQQKSRKNRKNG